MCMKSYTEYTYFVSSQPHDMGKTLKEHFDIVQSKLWIETVNWTLNITQSKSRIYHLM